jgi:hypothetical protein
MRYLGQMGIDTQIMMYALMTPPDEINLLLLVRCSFIYATTE